MWARKNLVFWRSGRIGSRRVSDKQKCGCVIRSWGLHLYFVLVVPSTSGVRAKYNLRVIDLWLRKNGLLIYLIGLLIWLIHWVVCLSQWLIYFICFIPKYAQIWFFIKGFGTSFYATFFLWFFRKNVPHVVFF